MSERMSDERIAELRELCRRRLVGEVRLRSDAVPELLDALVVERARADSAEAERDELLVVLREVRDAEDVQVSQHALTERTVVAWLKVDDALAGKTCDSGSTERTAT